MCAILARVFSQFSLRLEAHPLDLVEAEGRDAAWLAGWTRERAERALYEGMVFGHGIYPKAHVPFRAVPRGEAEQMGGEDVSGGVCRGCG